MGLKGSRPLRVRVLRQFNVTDFKLEVIKFADTNGKKAAARHFQLDRETILEWCIKRELIQSLKDDPTEHRNFTNNCVSMLEKTTSENSHYEVDPLYSDKNKSQEPRRGQCQNVLKDETSTSNDYSKKSRWNIERMLKACYVRLEPLQIVKQNCVTTVSSSINELVPTNDNELDSQDEKKVQI